MDVQLQVSNLNFLQLNACNCIPTRGQFQITKKEAIEAHVIDVQMAKVSNCRYPITKSQNVIAVIGHSDDHAPVT